MANSKQPAFQDCSFTRDIKHPCGAMESEPAGEAAKEGSANHGFSASWITSGFKTWPEGAPTNVVERVRDFLERCSFDGFTKVMQVEEAGGEKHPHHGGLCFRAPFGDRWNLVGARDLVLSDGGSARRIVDWKLRTVPGPNQLRAYGWAAMALDPAAESVEGWYVPLADGAPGPQYAGAWRREELPGIEAWLVERAELTHRLRAAKQPRLQLDVDSQCIYCARRLDCPEQQALVTVQKLVPATATPHQLVLGIERINMVLKRLKDMGAACGDLLEALHESGQLPEDIERKPGRPSYSVPAEAVVKAEKITGLDLHKPRPPLPFGELRKRLKPGKSKSKPGHPDAWDVVDEATTVKRSAPSWVALTGIGS